MENLRKFLWIKISFLTLFKNMILYICIYIYIYVYVYVYVYMYIYNVIFWQFKNSIRTFKLNLIEINND